MVEQSSKWLKRCVRLVPRCVFLFINSITGRISFFCLLTWSTFHPCLNIKCCSKNVSSILFCQFVFSLQAGFLVATRLCNRSRQCLSQPPMMGSLAQIFQMEFFLPSWALNRWFFLSWSRPLNTCVMPRVQIAGLSPWTEIGVQIKGFSPKSEPSLEVEVAAQMDVQLIFQVVDYLIP